MKRLRTMGPDQTVRLPSFPKQTELDRNAANFEDAKQVISAQSTELRSALEAAIKLADSPNHHFGSFVRLRAIRIDWIRTALKDALAALERGVETRDDLRAVTRVLFVGFVSSEPITNDYLVHLDLVFPGSKTDESHLAAKAALVVNFKIFQNSISACVSQTADLLEKAFGITNLLEGHRVDWDPWFFSRSYLENHYHYDVRAYAVSLVVQNIPSPKNLLLLGSGTCEEADLLQKAYGPDVRIYFAEIDPLYVKIGQMFGYRALHGRPLDLTSNWSNGTEGRFDAIAFFHLPNLADDQLSYILHQVAIALQAGGRYVQFHPPEDRYRDGNPPPGFHDSRLRVIEKAAVDLSNPHYSVLERV